MFNFVKNIYIADLLQANTKMPDEIENLFRLPKYLQIFVMCFIVLTKYLNIVIYFWILYLQTPPDGLYPNIPNIEISCTWAHSLMDFAHNGKISEQEFLAATGHYRSDLFSIIHRKFYI